jgi:endonuclease YncB( thermonuclease family)
MRARHLRLAIFLLILLVAPVLPLGDPTSAAPSERLQDGWYQVSRVIDGDSLRVRGLSKDIRLAGINAPEYNEQFGSRATATLRWLTAQDEDPGWIYLQVAYPSHDTINDRYRAHVWFYNPQWGGWILMQGYLASRGLAKVDRGYYASDRHYSYLVEMERHAQSWSCGIWGGWDC